MKRFARNEKGFTIVEVLVAIPIMGLLGMALVALLIQMLHSHNINERMVAVRQVQTAGYRVSQDGVQAQFITFGDTMTDEDGFLSLSWAGEWMEDDGSYVMRSVEVTYTLVPSNGSYTLERHEIREVSVDGDVDTSDVTNTVAQHLDADEMSCEWVGAGSDQIAFKVVSVVGTKTEERTYNISPRPG